MTKTMKHKFIFSSGMTLKQQYLISRRSKRAKPKKNIQGDNRSRASFCTGNSMNECHGPLVMASTYGHVDCTRYLVEVLNADIEEQGIGAQVNIIHEFCSTPINAASQLGCPTITKVLVEHGADIEITDRLGGFCMMTTAIRGHIQLVRYLISIGADVNKKNYEGETTLYKCAE
ncbi:protein fem-1 homolog C-like [Palaemon carinicauda]|uniref:protein fem-1 homolog C-like n=1 Tax=Palaemon carinicauda TaxID=392227 RepID=UPI0035B5AADC